MAKPSSTRTPRLTAPAEPVKAPAPAAPEAMFDQVDEAATGTSPDATAAQGTEEVGGGEAQPPQGEQAPAEQVDGDELFDEIFGDGEGTPVEDEAPAPPPPPETAPAPAAPSAGPERVLCGRVEGELHRVPLGVVQAILGDQALERVGHLRSSQSINDLQKRMRATDGRCAPVFFTQETPESVPLLFSGLDSVAAALNLGLAHLSVVTIAAGNAGEIQSWLSSQQVKAADHEDDIIFRVHSDDD